MTEYRTKPKKEEESSGSIGNSNMNKRISLAFGEDGEGKRQKDHDEGFSIRKIRTVTEEGDYEKGKSYINEKGEKLVPLSEDFKKEQLKKTNDLNKKYNKFRKTKNSKKAKKKNKQER